MDDGSDITICQWFRWKGSDGGDSGGIDDVCSRGIGGVGDSSDRGIGTFVFI